MTFLPQHTLIWTRSKASSVVKQGVGAHTPVHIFSLFSILLHHKLLSLQVTLKQIWAWEGKQDSEIPSKAFRLVVWVKGENGDANLEEARVPLL